MNMQKEFGDFQTPLDLAKESVDLIDDLFGRPDRVIEPTSGLGSFLEAASKKWGSSCIYEGYEINREYVVQSNERLSSLGVRIQIQNFFDASWQDILTATPDKRVLVIGNPPWVTNAALGVLGGHNLPDKTNFQRLRGFDAKTGKANFDIAEWILIRLIEALPTTAAIGMLCKTMTARKVLKHFWKTDRGLLSSSIFLLDARSHFNVSVDACLFFALGKRTKERTAVVYSSLSRSNKSFEFGLINGQLVSDIDCYRNYKDIDGSSPYTWRSGIKHDAANVMELTPCDGHYRNGLGEDCYLEPDYLYPLLKSSDLANERTIPRKVVLVTQRKMGDSTDSIQITAPKTWDYLSRHTDLLDARKSSIYSNRPRYSIFGVGHYSFATWKVAISGLYKSLRFVVVPPQNNRPVMLDDTCYFISCSSESEAKPLCSLFNSEPCQKFLKSLIFPDSKRPVTTEILQRISLTAIAQRLGSMDVLSQYICDREVTNEGGRQLCLVMEGKNEYGR